MLFLSSVVVRKTQTAKETGLLIDYPGKKLNELCMECCQVWNASRETEKTCLLLFCPFFVILALENCSWY